MPDANRLVLASNNAGKVREVAQILAELNMEVMPQGDFGVSEVAETGTTFVENAIIKARHAAEVTGLAAVADDSGLVVDALNGEPGVWSARYAAEGASDQANLNKVMEQLRDVPDQRRSARFLCVMVFMRHAGDPTPVIAQGSWEGSIGRNAAGDNGFGYDPVFWVAEHGCTAAELSAEVKNSLSHRGQALRGLVAAMQQQGHLQRR
jgi:XTP/dITP diphosphohydrolase